MAVEFCDNGSTARAWSGLVFVEPVRQMPSRRARRRVRAAEPRRRQVVVRFSDAELAVVRERAALAGSAMGAWIGSTAVAAADGSSRGPVGLPDLLRLHADVVLLERVATTTAADMGVHVIGLLDRLDTVIDIVVAQLGQRRL